MSDGQDSPAADRQPAASMVLYCLVRRHDPEADQNRFLLVRKHGQPTFPPTKFRRGEDLYRALVRPMQEDLGLPPGSYFPEEELPPVPRAGTSARYPGLAETWHLYPAYHFIAKEVPVTLIVFPEKALHHAPISPVDGRPMQRANVNSVQSLLGRD